jgi:galactofuranosylgalactofuranosylrhamnosyl-N-acetylglucosaminyl-diphospho-decaprenol beta-1,5/1,6-galactofuranosyltransferase
MTIPLESPVLQRPSQPAALEEANRLINFIFPSIQVCSEESLYFRLKNNAYYDYTSRQLSFSEYGEVLFDTYFNAFSLGKFKTYTTVNQLSLTVNGKGLFQLSFYALGYGKALRCVQQNMLDLSGLMCIPLHSFEELDDGIIYVRLKCIGVQGQLHSLAYVTETAPQAEVKLGIVITHFKREKNVKNAIRRLRDGLLENSVYKNSIQLMVVDNSNTLLEQDCEGAIVIRNKNYGGSGGFTRGLLHLKHDGSFTHCLFMDDDASCEIESIRRTITFLQYAKNEKLCIAGALLWENFPFLQHENGAAYSHGIVRPLKTNVDLRNPVNVMLNEMEERVDYGAWWYFAFPITEAKHLAFPFFVRGDDITFSLQNKFKIITLNGVCSWGESFTHKIAAMERYLTMRSTLQMAILNQPSAESKKAAARFFVKQVLNDLKTYNYDRANLMCEAMNDVLRGRDFWLQNISMDEKRKELTQFIQEEKIQKMPSVHEFPSGVFGVPEGIIRKLVRKLSLNGHLIPDFLLKQETYRLDRYQENIPKNTFRKRHLVYYDQTSRQGYYTTHSKKKFFKTLLSCAKGYLAYTSRFDDLVRQFSHATQEYMSVEFWKQQYS